MQQPKRSVLLDGISKLIDLGEVLNGHTGAFSFSLWTMFTQSIQGHTDGALISKDDYTIGATKDMFQVEVKYTGIPGGTGNDVVFYVWDNANQALIGKRADNLPANTPYHIVGTYDGGRDNETSVNLFIQGFIQTLTDYNVNPSAFQSISDTSAPLRIGAFIGENGQYGRFYPGYVSMLSIYNSALNATQIGELYNSGTPVDPRRCPLSSSSLMNYFPLGDPPDTISAFYDRLNKDVTGTGVNLIDSDITKVPL